MLESLPSLRDSFIIIAVALGVYLLLVALAQVIRRARGLRFGWTYHGFALASGLVIGLRVSDWKNDVAAVALQQLTAIALLLSAFPLAKIVNRIAWMRPGATAGNAGKEVPRVLPDATGLVIVIAITLVVLQYIYHVEVPGLLAGSGVIAIIVGLAMQDLLGNLLAGVGLHFDKSFTPGDWLEIDGTHAKVIELSWRSTRLITNDDVMIDVPNSNIVKSTILNFEKPTRKHAVKPLIGLHYDIPPAQAQRVLQQAAATVPGVCSDPVPVVYLKEFADSAIIYEINVWIDDHGLMDPVMSDVRVNCWYACKRAGFEIPYPQLTLHRPSVSLPNTQSFKTAAADALRTHPVFSFLSEAQADELLGTGKVSLYGINEYIVAQGSEGASMFFIAQGRVEVFLTRNEERITVASLKAGDCFGEMSVLTGERRSATVVARDEVAAIEIPKAAFSHLIQSHPELLQRLSEVLAARQLSNEKVTLSTTTQSRLDAARSSVMQRLRVFFELNN